MIPSVTTESLSYQDFRDNFPFDSIRPKQYDVLKTICDAFNSGFKIVVLEAPTGFGKSPVAIALARALGSSYICSATKDLQTQYVRDFPFLRAVKGMGNFTCPVKEDFIKNGTYACGKCGILNRNEAKKRTNPDECDHKTVQYGPCRSGLTGYKHSRKTCKHCIGRDSAHSVKFHEGCRYKTYPEDYTLALPNTYDEQVEISNQRREQYQAWYKNIDKNESWSHTMSFQNFEKIRDTFTPCPYYDQLNKGIIASHSIFNYANFLIFLRWQKGLLRQKDLLVLDEGHSIENQFVDQVGLSISKRTLPRYLRRDILEDIKYSYDDSIERWLIFLENVSSELMNAIHAMTSEEIRIEALDYLQRIMDVIKDIGANPANWIISKIDIENNKLTNIEFKPLDISSYCKRLFDVCKRTLIMSATILNIDSFCRNVGLDLNSVKFISVQSDFPIRNRPIYQMNTAYLNYETLQLESVQREISDVVDNLMSLHHNDKGIIHCTSYAQVRFIEKFISRQNGRRLILTDPERYNSRDEIIMEHFSAEKPTVLISPSLHTGLDLKDDKSRFQIIVKVPYPNRKDRWIEAKRVKDGAWYDWQTCIKLVQAYGRSIRSSDDWAKTYVLDAGFKNFVWRNKFPKWYTEAIS